MRIALSEWLVLERLKRYAATALQRLEAQLGAQAREHRKMGHEQEAGLLLDLASRTSGASYSLTAVLVEPVSEQTDGPGSEKTKTYVREPHSVGYPSGRRYFTADEVQHAKDTGLLKEGIDVTGPTLNV